MKTINIKGKEYVQVNERIKEFRSNDAYVGWSLTTEMLHLDDTSVAFKAIVADENGVIKSTGHAQEFRSSSNINKTSYVENCETSAIGRALGNLGIGIEVSVASAEELQGAIDKQETLKKKITKAGLDALKAKMLVKDVDKERICKAYGIQLLDELNEEQWLNIMRRLDYM